MNKLLFIGTIVNYKKLDGAMLITNTPKGLFLPQNTEVLVGFSETFCDKYILNKDIFCTINKTEIYLKNIDTKEKAQAMKEKGVFVKRNIAIAQNPDFLFPDDIIGSNVINIETNEIIGEVIEIWELPANNVWLVKTINGDLPLPVINDVIKHVDIKNKLIKINLLDGLMDLINNKVKAFDED